MSNLSLLVPSLQRFVAPPGLFDTLFPVATDEDMVGYLGDGIAECQLRGFFSTHVIDGVAFTALPDLTVPQGSLVVLFAGVRILQAEIRNRKSHSRQEANGLVNENDYAAGVMVELLKEYKAEKDLLIEQARLAGADVFAMADIYFIRQTTGLVGYGTTLDLDYAGYLGFSGWDGF